MNLSDFQQLYARHPQIANLNDWAKSLEPNIKILGLSGSSFALIAASLFKTQPNTLILIEDDSEKAAYLYNDIKTFFSPEEVFYFPSSYKRAIKLSQLDAANEVLRTEVLNRLANNTNPCIIVTSPEAVIQKVVSSDQIQEQNLHLQTGKEISIDYIVETLIRFGFNRVDFVYEPGQFSVRGSIVDIFSYAYELPFRCDFFGDEIDSIRVFDIETQLSKEKLNEINILPDLGKSKSAKLISFFDFIPPQTWISYSNLDFTAERIQQLFDTALEKAGNEQEDILNVHRTHIKKENFTQQVKSFRTILRHESNTVKARQSIGFNIVPQPIFHKNFDLVAENLEGLIAEGYKIYILSDSTKQTDRIVSIFEDRGDNITFQAVKTTLHEGFIDREVKIACYTDHQIFDRFHKFQLRTDRTRIGKVVLTLKELNQFQVGDYLVHVDHGVGTFGGLVRTPVNGKMQEMVKLIYKNDDFIFVSIHSLHRISKYKGKEGEKPTINKLGSGAWERLKERTKSKVKDIARELIKLYAQRKAEKGFRFSPDTYMQTELEASFIYEDTPDQVKATVDVKKDMESETPMDRLVCGDVGFGKTEIAMRAAFKAVADSKQVVVLVPTTVLALQHYQTFSERLKNFPCRIEYLSRARTAKQTKEVLADLEQGKVDIIIGTHKLVGKNIKFHNLGLLIIDEEQKFGVSVKEKLRQLKVNIDTLTMTATPIPRTLQFSLMGARDLSIINTPPPNRYPVQTELHTYDEDVIREAITLEMSRNGQVFFVHNRVQNIEGLKNTIERLIPGCRVAIGHGQMPPEKLEEIIIDFINYDYDVLVATTIIESGIDIPNVNTIIINSAHYFGLSDLHQLRGRVGRGNRKAYCYLLAPDLSLLTSEARRRLQAIETFSELGSGFNISMQDLDIRGAGNMLGAEQSGFIADLGYDTYQKILNEAVTELKEEEFSELYADEEQEKNNNTKYITDCQIDTDMELMFPEQYVENVSERISLYRELDDIETETELADFEKRIEDRFGKIPPQAQSLILVVRIRWMATHYGIERLVLKNEKMTAFLVSNMQSPYYQSQAFGALLLYATKNPYRCKLREQNGKRSIVFSNVKSVQETYAIFKEIEKLETNSQ
ncbi:transcription-repair coupling factor [Paludibacter sp. 221]|uniref:transcription-repair coupling factor n=1 Tax=Paludibacter sp. 221 TaxID=2302939 RepID=UPI0013D824B9|nr:transcription-repair coupling factor [Paludibacter sp. 221]NDV47350.1 transcription-repair coupling factor [Paludibacter sp. 221]